MAQPCSNPSLPINNHVPGNWVVRVASGSRSILPLPLLPVLRWIIHLQNRSKLTDKQLDKVRRIVHPKLKPSHFQIKTYYLFDAYYPMDNPSQTYSPSVVWTRPITMLFTGLSRVFDCEYFKGTSGCCRKLNEQRPQEAILRKNQGTCSHYKTHTVNRALFYLMVWN